MTDIAETLSVETFAGLPVEGTIERYTETGKSQRPKEELEHILRDVWSTPGMDEFKYIEWDQYTPYFNDGDACVFHSTEVRLVPYKVKEYNSDELVDPDDLHEHYEDVEGPVSLWSVKWDNNPRNTTGESRNKHLFPVIDALSPIEDGSFDVVLNGAFGDPSTVRVYRDKIVVSYYDHD